MAILLRFSLFLAIFSVSAQEHSTNRNYQQLAVNCVQCHSDPTTQAPLIGDTKRWATILKQGRDVVLSNLYLGYKGMPPLGYCSSCSQQDFVNLIKIMAGPIAAKNFDINKDEPRHAK